MKKVSIIMCFYNEEKYIKEAVQGILDQSYGNIELILVDDASTDKSVEIIEAFSDNRIILFKNEVNSGLAYCRNVGLDAATGEYAGFCDADDVCVIDKIEKQVKYLEEHKDIFVVSGYYDFIDAEGKKVINTDMRNGQMVDQEVRIRMLFENCVSGACALFRMDTVTAFGVRHDVIMRTCQDYHFWLQCLQHGKFHILNEILFHYRINHGSKSSQRKKQHNSEYSRILHGIIRYAWESRGLQLSDEAINFMYNFFFEYKNFWRMKDILSSIKVYQEISNMLKNRNVTDRKMILRYYARKCRVVAKKTVMRGMKTIKTKLMVK